MRRQLKGCRSRCHLSCLQMWKMRRQTGRLCPGKKRDEYGERVAVMVWNVTQQEAFTFVKYLLNCATNDKIRVLPNRADREDGLTHRLAFVTLLEGGPTKRILCLGRSWQL